MAGICGVLKFNAENERHGISKDLYYLLYGLQNRGQASAKAITQMKNPDAQVYFYNNGVRYTPLRNILTQDYIYCERKEDGIVRKVFDNKILLDLYGEAGIGGVSNTAVYKSDSLPYRYKMVAVGKDGWIENADDIKEFLVTENIPFRKNSTEVEICSKLFHYHFARCGNGKQAMKYCAVGRDDAPKLEGSYAMIGLTPLGLTAVSNGKPLGYVLREDRVYIASESAGPWSVIPKLNSNNFHNHWVDITPGEVIDILRSEDAPTLDKWIDKTTEVIRESPRIIKGTFPTNKRVCSFEWAYFARPDSVIFGKEAGVVRMSIGAQLAPIVAEKITNGGGDLDNTIVVPVLASGNWYAVGFSEKTRLPFIPGLYKNKYALKSFILDVQQKRDEEVTLKHIPSVNLLRGKEVVLVDDSIVRGTTMRVIVDLVREKGNPTNVHVVAGYPQKRYGCPYTSESPKKLIANELNLDEIRQRIGATTLTYGTHEMWLKALGEGFCYRCEIQGHV